jgi:hypothetical protein
MLTDLDEAAIDLTRKLQSVIEESGASDEIARYALAIVTVLRHGADLPLLIRISRNLADTGVEVEVLPGRVQ